MVYSFKNFRNKVKNTLGLSPSIKNPKRFKKVKMKTRSNKSLSVLGWESSDIQKIIKSNKNKSIVNNLFSITIPFLVAFYFKNDINELLAFFGFMFLLIEVVLLPSFMILKLN